MMWINKCCLLLHYLNHVLISDTNKSTMKITIQKFCSVIVFITASTFLSGQHLVLKDFKTSLVPFQKGYSYYNAGDFEKAILEFDKINENDTLYSSSVYKM